MAKLVAVCSNLRDQTWRRQVGPFGAHKLVGGTNRPANRQLELRGAKAKEQLRRGGCQLFISVACRRWALFVCVRAARSPVH